MIILEKKTFEISNIQNVNELNSLSIALNEKEQVSHIKISQDTIVFQCLDIEALLSLIQGINKNLVIKEVIDEYHKENYDFSKREEKKHYFMFRNMITEEDIYVLVERLESQDRYHDVIYDANNKVLMLTSSTRDVLSYLRKELFKINPSIEIIEHRRPIRSQDVFNHKFLMAYIRIAIFLVAFALALITARNQSFISPLMWFVVILVLSERLIKATFQNIKQFHFFKEDVLVFCALVMGIVAGAYVETCLAAIVYQLAVPFLNRCLKRVLVKIDRTVKIPEKGIKVVQDQEIEVSLYDLEIGDIIKISSKEIIPVSGIIVKGQTQINTYSNTSTYEYIDVKEGQEVNSGDINASDEAIYIQITKYYESSNLRKLMNIARVAPVYESKIEKYTKTLAYFYTPLMVILGIVLGVFLPIIDYKEFGSYIHYGAILLVLAGALSSHQSTSLGMLAGFAKAFQSGIVVESSLGLDSINATQTIVYDRFEGQDVTNEELDLFWKLSHMGKILVIFNDGPVALEDDQYTIYNYLTVEEKLEKMDSFIGPIVYIGDSFKDIQLLQKSYVGISRGGMADSKVVENSDIVLFDADLGKVYETFVIARKMRTLAIFNNFFTIAMKMILLVLAFSFQSFPIWMVVIIETLVSAFVMTVSASIIE